MRTAFKEWAIVVHALGRGDQILILRKGGISEGKGGFQVEHQEFLLFPTLFHQQRESVIPSAQARYDAIAPGFPSSDQLRIEFFAKIHSWKKLETQEDVARLRGHHIWKDEVIEERFEWGRGKHIIALFVRVFRLASPRQLPMLSEYGGCKSWVELAEDISVEGAEPVLKDGVFEERMKKVM